MGRNNPTGSFETHDLCGNPVHSKAGGGLLALRVRMALWTGLVARTIATEGGVRLAGKVNRPKDWAITRLSLKCFSAESASIAELAGAIKRHRHQACVNIP